MDSQNSASFDITDDVFSRTAESYDMLCDLFSLYTHRYWKAYLAKRVADTPGINFVDIAAGTGDIAIRVASYLSKNKATENNKNIVLADLCEKMLSVARMKATKKSLNCEYRIMNAHDLESIPDNSVDILTISFAMKICERDQVLLSAYRVLKPGGKFYCLEASRIPWRWLHSLYLTYMNICVPIIARIVTRGDKSAYNYLLRGIHDFPNQVNFMNEMKSVGFSDITYTNLSLGIVALHEASK